MVGRVELFKMLWYSEWFKVPFTETKGPSPTPEKQSHTTIPPSPKFTLSTTQSERYRSPGKLQTQTRPSDCQMEKCDSSLQSVSTDGAVLYTTASDALHCTCRCMAWIQLPWKPIPWSSPRIGLGLIWRTHEGCGCTKCTTSECRKWINKWIGSAERIGITYFEAQQDKRAAATSPWYAENHIQHQELKPDKLKTRLQASHWFAFKRERFSLSYWQGLIGQCPTCPELFCLIVQDSTLF